MGSLESIREVAEIVKKKAGNIAVVVSATSGTTDLLLKMGEQCLNNGPFEETLDELIKKHDQIINGLGVEVDLNNFWDEIRKLLQGANLMMEMSISAIDRLSGFGERISSKILAAYLVKKGFESEAVDAYNLIFCDDNFGAGNVIFQRSNAAIESKVGGLLKAGVIPVITGFVGQSLSGKYITLGRGGSDYTGAIVAAALDADELQIWTDVDGILNANPRLIKDAQVLTQLSFGEASELAYFGAKVLHPKTIKPAIKANIPVRILNTFNTKAVGTEITNQENNSLKSVTHRDGVIIVNICAAELLEAQGFLAKIFDVFGRNHIAVDVVSTSEVSVSLTVDELPDAVKKELEEFADVKVQDDMAVVCLVGNGIQQDREVLGKLFSNIAEHDVSMVSQGASKRNITFVVNAAEAPAVVEKVFNTFFK